MSRIVPACTLLPLILTAAPAVAMPGAWRDDFAGNGMDGPVYAVVDFGGQLIAGGAFGRAGDSDANNIASWDGQRWRPLGEGLTFGSPDDGTTPYVTGLCVHDGALIATGAFTRAGAVEASCVARWDGGAWHRFPGTFNGIVYTPVSYAGELLVGGRFTAIDSRDIRFVARWDGVAWQRTSTGLNQLASAFAPWDGRLAVGGLFTTADGVDCGGVALWNGAWWEPLGAGMAGGEPATWVFALTVFRGELIAGGVFTHADGRPAAGIARWDGSTWQAVGGGVLSREEPYVFALATYADHLVAGGAFTHAGGLRVDRVAAWDGQEWSGLGAGIDGWVRSLCPVDGGLYAGGQFSHAGGVDSPCVARWYGAVVPARGIELAVQRLGPARARVSIRLTGAALAATTHVYRGAPTVSEGDTPGALLRLTLDPLIVRAGEPAVWDDTDAPAAAAGYYLEELRGEAVVWHGPALLPSALVGTPGALVLSAAAPNPFAGATNIRFELPQGGAANLRVLDVRGRTVAVLVDAQLPAGEHRIAWDGRDAMGAVAAQGMYLVRLSAAGRQVTRAVAFAGR